MAKSQKLILDIAYIDEEFFEDVFLIGIVCAKPSYQFIWNINEKLNFNFCKNHDHEKEINETYFSIFSYEDSSKLIEHFIYENRKQPHYLLSEAKNIDYLWLIKGGHHSRDLMQKILQYLSQINIITHSFEIITETLKNRQILIL